MTSEHEIPQPMKKEPTAGHPGTYVDTPGGILTVQGTVFRTREADLRAFAAPVLARVSLADLLADAERWLQLPRWLALWLLPPLLWVLAPWQAAGLTVLAYQVVMLLSPAWVSLVVLRALRLFESVSLQAAWYVLVLSALAMNGHTGAAGVGLAGFVVFRLDVPGRVLHPISRKVLGRLYPLPRADQVLRALIVRLALRHRLSLPLLDRMGAEILASLPGRTRRSAAARSTTKKRQQSGAP